MNNTTSELKQVGKEALTLELINRLQTVKTKFPVMDDAARQRVDDLIAELIQGLAEFAAACW